jgi:hypothetical protein
MTLAGDGLLGLWFDIAPDRLDDFYEWHNREHMPERLGNPGFRSGRRFLAVRGKRQFMVLYETLSPDNVAGPEYMHNIRFESEWSLSHDLINNSRAIFRVQCSYGHGQGGSVASIRFNAADGRSEDVRRFLAHSVLPRLVDEPGVSAAHLLKVDERAMHASSNQGITFKPEPNQEVAPQWLVLVEGSKTPEVLGAAVEAAITDDALVENGAAASIDRGLYAVQYGLFRIL